ncbi:hypothetical protein HAP47_0002870 [Bradyrhizobium sp. 41S5]|uniref:hypothetical protein n=1 Tax=Bradyrhizobium sp. 41S5 TaxID=1404443 RepID=UPI00156BC789|nr:hypothetical protein [Bradyrhizobium sp. 41S5]UFX45687.1 hypothetical protein HAP47_0002870 [Bradyrhizobium sp. 41S5]
MTPNDEPPPPKPKPAPKPKRRTRRQMDEARAKVIKEHIDDLRRLLKKLQRRWH